MRGMVNIAVSYGGKKKDQVEMRDEPIIQGGSRLYSNNCKIVSLQLY